MAGEFNFEEIAIIESENLFVNDMISIIDAKIAEIDEYLD